MPGRPWSRPDQPAGMQPPDQVPADLFTKNVLETVPPTLRKNEVSQARKLIADSRCERLSGQLFAYPARAKPNQDIAEAEWTSLSSVANLSLCSILTAYAINSY